MGDFVGSYCKPMSDVPTIGTLHTVQRIGELSLWHVTMCNRIFRPLGGVESHGGSWSGQNSPVHRQQSAAAGEIQSGIGGFERIQKWRRVSERIQ